MEFDNVIAARNVEHGTSDSMEIKIDSMAIETTILGEGNEAAAAAIMPEKFLVVHLDIHGLLCPKFLKNVTIFSFFHEMCYKIHTIVYHPLSLKFVLKKKKRFCF